MSGTSQTYCEETVGRMVIAFSFHFQVFLRLSTGRSFWVGRILWSVEPAGPKQVGPVGPTPTFVPADSLDVLVNWTEIQIKKKSNVKSYE